MPVTDDQIAALRAYLAGDFDEHRRLRTNLGHEALDGLDEPIGRPYCSRCPA